MAIGVPPARRRRYAERDDQLNMQSLRCGCPKPRPYFRGSIRSIPPMYFRNGSGMVTEPSAF
jgi:hypothetical protein